MATPKLMKGETQVFTLTFSAPIDALPATLEGVVQLREREDKRRVGESIARPLPIGLSVVWAEASNVVPGVTFAYPEFGRTASLVVTDYSQTEPLTDWDFDKTIAVQIASSDQLPATTQFAVAFGSNQSLSRNIVGWFGDRVDRTGALLASGIYQQRSTQNGFTLLVRTVDPPASVVDAPLPEIYAMSRNGDVVLLIQTGNDNQFDLLGVGSESRVSAYLALIESIELQ